MPYCSDMFYCCIVLATFFQTLASFKNYAVVFEAVLLKKSTLRGNVYGIPMCTENCVAEKARMFRGHTSMKFLKN